MKNLIRSLAISSLMTFLPVITGCSAPHRGADLPGPAPQETLPKKDDPNFVPHKADMQSVLINMKEFKNLAIGALWLLQSSTENAQVKRLEDLEKTYEISCATKCILKKKDNL